MSLGSYRHVEIACRETCTKHQDAEKYPDYHHMGALGCSFDWDIDVANTDSVVLGLLTLISAVCVAETVYQTWEVDHKDQC